MNDSNPKIRQVTPVEFMPPPSGTGRPWHFRPSWLVLGAVVLVVAYLIYFLATAVSLRVALQPAQAQLRLQGGLSIPLGDSFLLRPGEYHLDAQAPGYQPYSQTVVIAESGDLELRLEPLPGTLRINAKPEEITALQVAIDNRQLSGANPLEIRDLVPGSYDLFVDAPLYEARTLQVEIRGRELTDELDISLTPAWSEVRLRSVPSGAQVTDSRGAELGSTPLSLRLEQGTHQLSFAAPGYQPAALELQVAVDQPQTPDPVVLVPQESRLNLASIPSGAVVILDGEYRGETPLELGLLPERDYQLRLFKAGFAARERTVRLDRGEDRTLSENLAEVTGQLTVNVSPADAEIWVDGQRRATGSTELVLSTVNHRIEVRSPGYQSQSRTFLPIQDQRQVLSFNLLTEEQAIWASIPQRYQYGGHSFSLFRDPGPVQLGSSRREPDRRANEVEWTAQLQRAFYVSVHEVTNAQFRRYKPQHSSGNFARRSLDGNEQPVVGVTWQEAALYCNWLSEQAGLPPFYQTVSGFVSGVNPESTGYRLLTEAEWVWLARVTASGLTRRYPWGDEAQPQAVDNFAGAEIAGELNFTLGIQDSYPVSAPVGSFPANDKGIYDLGGNVAEYLHDWYAAETPSDQTLIDPLGPEVGEYHVIRGASWSRGYLPQLRLAYRDYDALGRNDLGFRIARYAR